MTPRLKLNFIISGTASQWYNQEEIDWVPSLNLGHDHEELKMIEPLTDDGGSITYSEMETDFNSFNDGDLVELSSTSHEASTISSLNEESFIGDGQSFPLSFTDSGMEWHFNSFDDCDRDGVRVTSSLHETSTKSSLIVQPLIGDCETCTDSEMETDFNSFNDGDLVGLSSTSHETSTISSSNVEPFIRDDQSGTDSRMEANHEFKSIEPCDTSGIELKNCGVSNKINIISNILVNNVHWNGNCLEYSEVNSGMSKNTKYQVSTLFCRSFLKVSLNFLQF